MVSVASRVQPLSERRFFIWMALTMALAAFAGFAPTYYLVGFNDAVTPVLTPRLHVHGALATAWMLLLVAQVGLVATGRRDLHKLVGSAGVVIATAILVSGIFVAINSERRVHTDANAGTLADPYVFLIFPFVSVGLFAVFVAAALLNRRRPDRHKRWMMLGTMSMLVPALARIATQLVQGAVIPGVPGVVGGIILMNVFIAALAIHDLRALGRLHPVTLWGGGALLISEPLRFAIGYSAPWQTLARTLMG